MLLRAGERLHHRQPLVLLLLEDDQALEFAGSLADRKAPLSSSSGVLVTTYGTAEAVPFRENILVTPSQVARLDR